MSADTKTNIIETLDDIKGIQGLGFAYDGCHKIYILEDLGDVTDASESGYRVYEMDGLLKAFENSCGLRFINNWKLDKTFVSQFQFQEDEE